MGVPDGMKVDVEGNVYCTGSAGIHIISPKGELLGRLHTPEHAANMAWAGDDWCTMYITARGVVYRTRLGIPGVPHGEANRRQALAMARKA
jgi:gluconolactonase